MTTENTIFLNFIEQQFDKGQSVCLLTQQNIEKGFFFYGYDNILIEISSNINTTLFSFCHNKSSVPLASFNIPYQEAKHFIDKMYSIYYNYKISELHRQYDPDPDNYVNQQIKVVNSYLKNVVIEEKEINSSFVLSIPSEYKGVKLLHKLRLGKIFIRDNQKIVVNFTGVVNFNLTLDIPKDKGLLDFPYDTNFDWIQLYFPMAGWEIMHYPCMKNFVHIDGKDNDLPNLLNSLKEFSPILSNMLHANILNNKLIQKDETKKHKI